MDRRVKERLVGASILVVLIVLIVPELLSGPASPPATARLPVGAPQPVRNVTVDLATNKAPAQEAVAAPAQAPPHESAQAAPHESAQAAPHEPAQAPHEPLAVLPASAAPRASPPASLETAGPPPTSLPDGARSTAGGRSWAVQLGSFANRDNAEKLVRQLKAQGFTVYVSSIGSGPATRHRVRVGPLADRGAAVQVVAKLKSMGQTASIVQPGA